MPGQNPGALYNLQTGSNTQNHPSFGDTVGNASLKGTRHVTSHRRDRLDSKNKPFVKALPLLQTGEG